MLDKFPKLLWGTVAFGIYFLLVGLLIYYFNMRSVNKPKHYVKKDEKRIQVTLTAPKQKKVSEPKVKPKPENKSPIKKDTKKKVIKEKIVKKKPKKKKDENLTKSKPKKIKTKKAIDLFSNVDTKKKKIDIKMTDNPIKKKVRKNLINLTDATPSAIEKINKSLKNKKNMDTGEENAYFSKVQNMLQSWPARSDFLGEEAKVSLFIKPTGKFEFQVTYATSNISFGKSIMNFLEQLQHIGFGRHNAGRTYEFEVEFSTKE